MPLTTPASSPASLYLGFQSIMLTLGIVLSLFISALAPWVLGLWALKLAVEFYGMGLGTKQLERPRPLRRGPPSSGHCCTRCSSLPWSVWSFLKPGAWYAGANHYRRRFFKRRLREFWAEGQAFVGKAVGQSKI